MVSMTCDAHKSLPETTKISKKIANDSLYCIWHFDNLVWYAWTRSALIGNTFPFHKTLNWFDQYKRPQQWRDALMSRWFPNMECPLAGQLEIVGFAQPPFELIRRTKPCQDTAVKGHLPQDIWLLFICLWKKCILVQKSKERVSKFFCQHSLKTITWYPPKSKLRFHVQSYHMIDSNWFHLAYHPMHTPRR